MTLALSLPPGEARNIVVSLTERVVVFSILVQGMIIGKLVKRVIPCKNKSAADQAKALTIVKLQYTPSGAPCQLSG